MTVEEYIYYTSYNSEAREGTSETCSKLRHFDRMDNGFTSAYCI